MDGKMFLGSMQNTAHTPNTHLNLTQESFVYGKDQHQEKLDHSSLKAVDQLLYLKSDALPQMHIIKERQDTICHVWQRVFEHSCQFEHSYKIHDYPNPLHRQHHPHQQCICRLNNTTQGIANHIPLRKNQLEMHGNIFCATDWMQLFQVSLQEDPSFFLPEKLKKLIMSPCPFWREKKS